MLTRIGNRICCPPINIGWDSRLSGQNNPRANGRYFIDISIKPVLTRAATWVFCEEIVKSAELCSKYFSWNKKTALAMSMIGTNFFLGSMVPVSQQAFREFVNSCISSSNNFDIYIYPLIYLLGIVICIIVAHAMNAISCMKLRNDLAFEMRGKLAESWEEMKVGERYKKTSVGNKIENPSFDIVFMTTKLCEYLVNLVNARISTLSLFAGALRSMYLNSGFISVSLLGITIEFPYLILICFIHVYGFGSISFWANAIFKKNTIDKNDALNTFQSEPMKYEESNKLIHGIDERSLFPQFGLSFLNKANSECSMVLGAITLLLSGNIDGITIVNMAQNFSYAAVQASWHRLQLDIIKKLEGAYERVHNILIVIEELSQQEQLLEVVDSN